MEPQPFGETRGYICGKCNCWWISLDDAERCCKCPWCGLHCAWSREVTHEECWAKQDAQNTAEALEAAALVPGYQGPFLIAGKGYQDVSDLLDAVAPDDIPDFSFCAKYDRPWLDMEAVMETVRGEMDDDWEPVMGTAQALLYAAIETWNFENRKNGAYWKDRRRKWSKADLLGESAAVKEESGGDDE